MAAYNPSDTERRVEALNTFKSLTYGVGSFADFQSSWRQALGKLSRAGVTKDPTELYTRYLELLPDACSTFVALHPSKPKTHREAADLAKYWYQARSVVRATSVSANVLEDVRTAEERDQDGDEGQSMRTEPESLLTSVSSQSMRHEWGPLSWLLTS